MSYTVNGRAYDFNSSANQTIKSKFVDREVLACISDMAEYLFDWDGEKYASYDDLSNYYQPVCSECGDSYGFEKGENDEGETIWTCQNCDHVFTDWEHENLDTEPQEVYEWWIVSSWLGEKLKDHGEVVLERWGGWIWGRCTSGQAILLDDVISDICCEMGILEGQSYDWSKHGVV